MRELLQALEKVGVTEEVLRATAVIVAASTGLLGGAVVIAAATRNWPKQKWEKTHVPIIMSLMMLAWPFLFAKPPAAYAGAFLLTFAFAWGIAHSVRRWYFHPNTDCK